MPFVQVSLDIWCNAPQGINTTERVDVVSKEFH